MNKVIGYALLAITLCVIAFGLGFARPHVDRSPAAPAALVESQPAAPVAIGDQVFAVTASVVNSPLVAPVAVGVGMGIAICLCLHFTPSLRDRRRMLTAINTLPANVGSSEKARRFRAAAAMTLRYALCKKGADDEHAAIVAAASDEPIGAFTDESAAAEDLINVDLFGINGRTLPLVAKVAITLGADVYSDGTGKVTIKPTAAGTYWRVGKAFTASGADGDPIEVMPIKPRKLIVIAALGNTNSEISGLTFSSTPTQAEANALRDKCEELADDVRAIAAALDGDADVALATT